MHLEITNFHPVELRGGEWMTPHQMRGGGIRRVHRHDVAEDDSRGHRPVVTQHRKGARPQNLAHDVGAGSAHDHELSANVTAGPVDEGY